MSGDARGFAFLQRTPCDCGSLLQMSDSEDISANAPTAPAKYVALARRYRPTSFDEVIGQQHVTRTLQNAIRAGRVHHAYLFTGSRGIGKTTVARILARALNHPDGPTPTPPPPTDAEAEIRNAVDVIEIDGASHTGVDDVRELRDNARYLPANSRHKIYIIDEVHMLSTSAFNALLKTLEEPPAHVVFMFATTEPHKIPATILSRCQRFDFKRVPTATIVEHLKGLLERESVDVDEAGLALIARAAEGGVRDALSLLDQVIAYAGETDESISAALIAEVLGVADRRVLFDLSAAILEHDAAAALGMVDRLFAEGHDIGQFAQALTAHLRDLVVVATCDQPEPLVEATDSELTELREQAKRASGPLLQLLFERFVQAAEQIARSQFPRLLLEMAVIELAQMEPLVPLGDLLQRLEQLERRVTSTRPGERSGGGQSPPDTRGQGEGSPSRAPSRGASAARASTQASGAQASKPSGSTHASKPPGTTQASKPSTSSQASKPSTSTQASKPSTSSQASEPPPSSQASEPPPSSQASEPPTSSQASGGAAQAERESDSEEAAAAQSSPASDDIHRRWRGLLDQLRGPWVGIFSAGTLMRWEGDRVELAFPPGFELESAQDRSRRESFLRACAEVLGRSLSLEVRALTEDEQRAPEVVRQSALEAREHEKRSRATELREEALDHPITRQLIDELGAKVTRVVTETEATSA
jgi:DNA polymerase-3 subunit gamma/tau